ncbi:peptidylprolyl isomerase [Streptococcus himalayensis]|uniref:Peptidyl-prolyl cis-trans isomerase n=1 Tax=Streptococcus himalayensis TaxID=1888195 RepID=A0A917A7R9_9STRE|nr:peptidylprolyl isomerase [Streptococcus himalayensis]GGE31607.1 peptidyl-prolyl cis-trans isomerase [Streptococcus himalayensis]
MKKLLLLTAASSLFLWGCTDVQRALRGDEYVDSSLAAESRNKESEQYAKELEDALTNKHAVFPQLTDKVEKDQAEVAIKTSEGAIRIKLFPTYAPLAVENFLTHAKEGYYNGVIFHRIIQDFMIQTGDPKGNGTGGESIWAGKDASIDSGQGFKNEISPYLYNIRGALAMANAGADTNGSQFFINQNKQNQTNTLDPQKYPKAIIEAYQNGGNPSLDGNYTVFGQVLEGMDIVDKIAASETDERDKPKTDVKIESIEILQDYDLKK